MMKLKQEFVETICRLFLEKHCPAAFNMIMAQKVSANKIEENEDNDEKN